MQQEPEGALEALVATSKAAFEALSHFKSEDTKGLVERAKERMHAKTEETKEHMHTSSIFGQVVSDVCHAAELTARSNYRKDRMETAIKYKQMLGQDVTQEVQDLVQFIKHVDPHLEKAYGARRGFCPHPAAPEDDAPAANESFDHVLQGTRASCGEILCTDS